MHVWSSLGHRVRAPAARSGKTCRESTKSGTTKKKKSAKFWAPPFWTPHLALNFHWVCPTVAPSGLLCRCFWGCFWSTDRSYNSLPLSTFQNVCTVFLVVFDVFLLFVLLPLLFSVLLLLLLLILWVLFFKFCCCFCCCCCCCCCFFIFVLLCCCSFCFFVLLFLLFVLLLLPLLLLLLLLGRRPLKNPPLPLLTIPKCQ